MFWMIVGIVLAIFVVLYLLAIMPRMAGRPDTKVLRGKLYAHRGLHDNASEAPENSMEAFRRAVEAGYGIELDIQLTADKVPVVFHDYTLQRICGVAGRVSDYTYEELQKFRLCGSEERIPAFVDVLTLVSGRVPLIVEFKVEWMDPELCPLADAMLKDYKGRYCIESFNPLVLLWYRKNRPEVIRGMLSQDYRKEKEYKGLLYFALGNLLLNFLCKPDFIAYNHWHHTMLSRRLCRRLYRNLAVGWTIKSKQELERAKRHFDLMIFDSFIPE